MKSYVKVYGPPLGQALRALERVAHASTKTVISYYSSTTPAPAHFPISQMEGRREADYDQQLDDYLANVPVEASIDGSEFSKLVRVLRADPYFLKIRREYAALGFLCDRHPLTLFGEKLEKSGIVKAAELHRHAGKTVRTAGLLITGKVVSTRHGDTMEFSFTMDPGGELVGNVEDANGQPLAGARIRVLREGVGDEQLRQAQKFLGGAFKTATTSDEGDYGAYVLIKTDLSGDEIWQKLYDYPDVLGNYSIESKTTIDDGLIILIIKIC